MVNEQGYVRIKKCGPDRDKYEHRAVIERLLGHPIPPGMEVHHQDFNRRHNCPHNLVLMPAEFNNRLKLLARRKRKRWQR